MGFSRHFRPLSHSLSVVHVSHVPRKLPLTGGAMWHAHAGQNDVHVVGEGHASAGWHASNRVPSELQNDASVP